MTVKYIIKGITDEVTTCEQCGRKNLKKTVALMPVDGDDVVYFGCDCAAMALRGTKKDRKIIESEAGAISYAVRAVAQLGVLGTPKLVTRVYGYAADVRDGKVRIQLNHSRGTWRHALIAADGEVTEASGTY